MPKKMEKSKLYSGVYKYLIKTKTGKTDYSFYITYKNASGKQEWEKIGKKSDGYKENYAKKIRDKRVQQIRHGETVTKKKYTLNELFDNYYLPHAKSSKTTWDRDKQRYDKYIRDNLGSFIIQNINAQVVQEFKHSLEQKGLKTQTVNHYLAVISQTWNYTKGLGLHDVKSPFRSGKLDSGVSIDEPKNERERYLTTVEINKLLSTLRKKNIDVYRMALISVNTGLRRSEIFNLRLKNIDTKNKRIVLTPSQTKSDKPRSVVIRDDVYNEIQKHIKENNITYNEDLLFVTNFGNVYKKIPDVFSKTVDELGLNNNVMDLKNRVSFHTLRHSFASHMAMLGTPIVTLQSLLGHKTIDMTMRYSHLIPDHSDQFINQLPY